MPYLRPPFLPESIAPGKGPLPKRFSLTDAGLELLKDEVLTALAATRERDRRFDLALAALPVVKPQDAIRELRNKKAFLQESATRIKEKYESDGGNRLPPHVRALFEHPLVLIEAENNFVDRLIKLLSQKRGSK